MPSTSKPSVIGLVGGIASGKSTVARILSEMGAVAIDADALGHDILKRPLIARQLVQEFGESISSADGIDRAALGKLVFDDDELSARRRKKLEAIVHPLIHAEAVRELRRLMEDNAPPKAIVIDAPLLLEASWAPMCDLILFVEAPRELRLARCLERGWTETMFSHREAAQMPIDQKKQASTHVVSSLSEQELRHQLRLLWEKLTA